MVERIEDPKSLIKEIPNCYAIKNILNKPHRSRTKAEIEEALRSCEQWSRVSELRILQLASDVNALVGKRDRDRSYIQSLETKLLESDQTKRTSFYSLIKNFFKK